MTHGLSAYLHNQKLRKPKLNGLRVGLLSRRDPRKTPVRMKKTKSALKFCPLKPAQELLKCNRQNKLEQNSNYQSMKVPPDNRILSLNSVAN